MTEEQKRKVEENLGLVRYIARRFLRGRYSLTLDDLVQYGTFGLIRAVENFDDSKDVAFSTFATVCIQNSIVRSIDNYDLPVRIPVYLREQIRQAQRDNDTETLHQLSVVSEIAGIPLTTDMGNPRDKAYKHILLIDPSPTPEEWVVAKDEQRWLRDTLNRSSLSEKERFVIEYSFGFHGDPLTPRKVGELLGLSRERVRQIREEALAKIKRQVRREERLCCG